MKVDITNRQVLNSLLGNLNENTLPRWGKMKPQNMVEHLAKTLQYSNGKKEIAQRTSEEEGLKAKQHFIYSDAEMSRGVKSPLLPQGEDPIPFEFSSLDEAKVHLNKELDDFEIHHASHPVFFLFNPVWGSSITESGSFFTTSTSLIISNSLDWWNDGLPFRIQQLQRNGRSDVKNRA